MTAPLSFILPLTIQASMVTSSTAVSHSTTEATWNAATSYAKGVIVFRSTFGRRYENLVPGVNSGLPEDTPDRWYDLGATDQMSMFDAEVSTQTIADDTLTVVFQPGAFNSIFLAGLDGTWLSVTVKAAPGGATIYSYTGTLEGSEPSDYYEYCFDPFKAKTDFIAFGVDPYGACEVTITVTNPGGIARCGMASMGDLTALGQSLQGVTVEPKSYAKIATDTRGATSIRKGKSARDMAINALVPLDETDAVIDALTKVMGVPCVWIGTDSARLKSMRTFGLGNGKMNYDSSYNATLSLTVNGMI